MEINIQLSYFIGLIVLAWLPWVALLVIGHHRSKNLRFFLTVLMTWPLNTAILWSLGARGQWLIGAGALFFCFCLANLLFITYCTHCGKQARGLKLAKAGFTCDYCSDH